MLTLQSISKWVLRENHGNSQGQAYTREKSLENIFHTKGMDHTHLGQSCLSWGKLHCYKVNEISSFYALIFNKPG